MNKIIKLMYNFFIFFLFAWMSVVVPNNQLKDDISQLTDLLKSIKTELKTTEVPIATLITNIKSLSAPKNYQEYENLLNNMIQYFKRTSLDKEAPFDEQFLKSTVAQASRYILDQYNAYQRTEVEVKRVGKPSLRLPLSSYIGTANMTRANEQIVKTTMQRYIEAIIENLAPFFNIPKDGLQATLNEIIKRYLEVFKGADIGEKVTLVDINQLTNLLKIAINYAFVTALLSELSLDQEPFKSALSWSLEDEVRGLYKIRSTALPAEPEKSKEEQEAQERAKEEQKEKEVFKAREEAYKDMMQSWMAKLQEVSPQVEQ